MSTSLLDAHPEVNRLAKASRRAGWVTLSGAVLLCAAFAWGFRCLHVLNSQLKQKQDDLQKVNDQVVLLQAKQNSLIAANEQLDRKNREMVAETDALRNGYRRCQDALRLQISRKYDQAVIVCDEVLSHDSQNVVALALKAHCLCRMMQYESALSVAERAKQLDPNYLPATWTIFLVQLKTDRRQAAETLRSLLDANVSNYYYIRFNQEFQDVQRYREIEQVLNGENRKIQEIQQGLIELHYLHDKVDGLIGPRSERAIEKFCTDHGFNYASLTTSKLADVILQAVHARTK